VKTKTKPKPAAKSAKTTRNTLPKAIATVAKTNPSKALALATYGSDGEAVSNRLSSRNDPAAFRLLTEAGVSSMIQDWLFLGHCETDPFLQAHSERELRAWKREQLLLEMRDFFTEPLEMGDWKFFHNFADKLKAEVAFRDAAYLKNRSPIHAKLLASKLFEGTANLSKFADELAENEFPQSKKPKSLVAQRNFDNDKSNRRKNIYRNLVRTAQRLTIEYVADSVGRKPKRTDKQHTV
jgi:hypothetical protein